MGGAGGHVARARGMVTAGGAEAGRAVHLGLSAGPALVDDLDVVVEDGGDDGDHVGLDDAGPDIFRAADANVEDALKSEIPLPHVHHVLAAAMLEDAYEALDAAVDGQDVADAG